MAAARRRQRQPRSGGTRCAKKSCRAHAWRSRPRLRPTRRDAARSCPSSKPRAPFGTYAASWSWLTELSPTRGCGWSARSRTVGRRHRDARARSAPACGRGHRCRGRAHARRTAAASRLTAWRGPSPRHHAMPGERASQPAPAAVTGQVSRATARSPVEVDSAHLEALGVRFEPVAVEVIAEPVRAVATVVPDESRISHVHTRVAGWVEQLDVNTTGERYAGQPLARIFSQELSRHRPSISGARGAGTRPRGDRAGERASTVLGMTRRRSTRSSRAGRSAW